jgi:chitodextrinase
MADFKISRIRFTWKGTWTTATGYNPDDVVHYGGKAYVCLVKHTSSSEIYTDINAVNSDVPPVAVPRWELMFDGYTWKGDWTANEFYDVGDIVKYFGITYRCIAKHVSSDMDSTTTEEFENDKSNWVKYVDHLDYRFNWQPNTYYRLNDVVKYNGIIYFCTAEHQSKNNALGLEADAASWDIVNFSDSWKSTWQISFRYRENDVVRYNGRLFRCVTGHTSSSVLYGGFETDVANWEIIHQGIEYQGTWSNQADYYKETDLVKYGAGLWIANAAHVPATNFDVSKWTLYSLGFEFETQWSSAVQYQIGDVVRYGGYVYKATANNQNENPTGLGSWTLVQQGVNFRGEWASSIAYSIGDAVRRNGQLYIALSDNINQQTDDGLNWDLIIPGEFFKNFWTTSSTYVLGDVVTFRGSSYRCILRHLSNQGNRPDRDTTNTYWVLFVQGVQGNVLSRLGDIKTFDIGDDLVSTERVALPIGNAGTVLRANNGSVGYRSFNQSQKVYFVGTDGVDDPSQGNTLDNPWRTVRYACGQITGPATVFVKHGVYDEVLPIRVPAFVAIVGDELRGTTIRPAATIIPPQDESITIDIIERVSENIEALLIHASITTQSIVDRIYLGPVLTLVEVNIIRSLITDHLTALQGSAVSITGTNTLTSATNRLNMVNVINTNRAFLIDDALILSRQATQAASYNFDEAKCERDLNLILDAIIYDLRYPGNYKVVEAGYYYANAADGARNARQNMFLMRDGTGLRNCTLSGLTGELTPPVGTEFFNQRVTAGAYASLDPGWGPGDDTAWVGTRSPYVQNVTTFGTACIGLKVDGTLHGGGNKTIVANDFTQVLSDGIGAWVNKDGASELVSVFTYYNHIGYLAENGGKIRATNGNNSYGKYGCVSLGSNADEEPILATVFNRFYDATIAETFTVAGAIKRLFFSNAGQNYTTASAAIAGSGINAAIVMDEFRDGAVYEVRIKDPGDSSNAGGSGYFFTRNSAQAGNTTQITIAASDENEASNYETMRIFLTGGTAAGQYGYIDTYDAVTKIATVRKESDNTPGWDHIQPGATIASLLDTTTAYAIEPRLTFSSPGFSATTITMPSSREWKTVAYGAGKFVAIVGPNSNVFAYSITMGSTWTESTLPVSGNWTKLIYADDKFVVVSSDGKSLYSTNGTSWTQSSMIAGNWQDVVYGGGKFIAVASDNLIGASSPDGIIWSSVNMPDFGDWKSIAYGKGVYVAVAPSDSTVSGIATSSDGVTWTGNDSISGVWEHVAYGNGRFVVLEGGDTAYFSFNGTSWSSNALPVSDTWSDLIYANGIFIALARNSQNILTSTDGILWNTNSLGQSEFWSGIAYGNKRYLVISNTEGDSSGSNIGRIISTGARPQARAVVVSGRLSAFELWETGSGYDSPPVLTITDPNISTAVNAEVRIAESGVLSSPTLLNEGQFYQTINTITTITGDGFKDQYQTGKELIITNISRIPGPGDNLRIQGIDDYTYKVVSAEVLSGQDSSAFVKLTILKALDRDESPDHNTPVTIREQYSQIRITGHDFLDIGLGNFLQTNYPNVLAPIGTVRAPENEFEERDGGRVFYTSTDQDGNFRVGELFRVDQATGAVTLNADFFELEGLEEIKLGGVSVGGTGVVIREFSTDSTFTADSNNIIPTQKAIKKFLEQKVSGGGSEAITGGVTAGVIIIGPNLLDTTTQLQINIPVRANFTRGVDGSMLALNYFLRDQEIV